MNRLLYRSTSHLFRLNSTPSFSTSTVLANLGIVEAKEAYPRYLDHTSKHRSTVPVGANLPKFSRDSFVSPSSTLTGNVQVYDRASIWYNVVVKAEQGGVVLIGAYSNVQDGSVVVGGEAGATIGHYVTVGHAAFINGATVEDESLVGIAAVMEPGSVLGSQSILAAGAVLPAGVKVPSGELWVGSPARKARDLSADERAALRNRAIHYYDLSTEHRDEFYLDGDLHVAAEAEGIPVGYKEWPATQA